MGVTGEIRVSSALFSGTVSFSAATREERAEVFFVLLCALLVFFACTFLFVFFDGDTIDFYSRGIDIARITRWNGHQHIQSLHNLTKNSMFIIQMRCGNVSNKEL